VARGAAVVGRVERRLQTLAAGGAEGVPGRTGLRPHLGDRAVHGVLLVADGHQARALWAAGGDIRDRLVPLVLELMRQRGEAVDQLRHVVDPLVLGGAADRRGDPKRAEQNGDGGGDEDQRDESRPDPPVAQGERTPGRRSRLIRGFLLRRAGALVYCCPHWLRPLDGSPSWEVVVLCA